MFTRKEIKIKNRPYTQLVAADISERWDLTARLRQTEESLKLRGEELKDTIAGLNTLCREREVQIAKLRAHDVLGQHLSLMLRAVRSEQALDFDLLRAQSETLLDSLRISKNEASPREKFDSMRLTYETIGVQVQLFGDLPENDRLGYIFVDVISEGVVNAVRHGYSTVITARIDCSDNCWSLKLSNDGRPPPGPIVEGGGFGLMRSKVQSQGGALKVTAHPRFMLEILLPGGETGA
jgi:glucose-6-phosphate-specific signal transduction histidine kinase